MSEYLIQGETLTAIADAIRAKTAVENDIPTTAMAEEIMSIATTMLPGNITALATGEFTLFVNPSEIYGYTITHNLGVVPNFFILYARSNWVTSSDPNTLVYQNMVAIDHQCDALGGGITNDTLSNGFMTNGNGLIQNFYSTNRVASDYFKTDTIKMDMWSFFKKGYTYYWIAGKAKYLKNV